MHAVHGAPYRGGDTVVKESEMVAYISEITGVEANLVPSDNPLRVGHASGNTRRKALAGDCRVDWREGIASALEAHFPGSVKNAVAV